VICGGSRGIDAESVANATRRGEMRKNPLRKR